MQKKVIKIKCKNEKYANKIRRIRLKEKKKTFNEVEF